LRYRFEDVAQDTFDKNAHASTLRTTLGYRSRLFHGLGVALEVEDVSDLGLGDQHDNLGFGSLWNGVADRPGIADPELTEMNQVILRYEGLPDTKIEAGRQEIALGTERFVGPVGWRQNHQVFDGVRLTQTSIPRTKLTYAYLRNANRVFGDNADMDTHLLDAAIEVGEAGDLTAYIYRLDYNDDRFLGLSTISYGARWQGEAALGSGWSLPYHAEYARQTEAGDNPDEVASDYLRLELVGKREALHLTAGYELLGAEAGKGRFTTPLATLHGYNGWADRFLVTPNDGLRDLYLVVGGKLGAFSGKAAWHDFGADLGGLDYGSEIDAEIRYDSPWKQVFALKLADYCADGFSTDTRKIWFWTQYAF
jgi:hypothetical protein